MKLEIVIMNILTTCPCCSGTMLHHIGHHRDFWFCRNCWSEMPNLDGVERKAHVSAKYQPQLTDSSNDLRKSILV